MVPPVGDNACGQARGSPVGTVSPERLRLLAACLGNMKHNSTGIPWVAYQYDSK
jgi:hypothetical protein